MFVFQQAIHAADIKVDSILCLPELYFKPKTEDALVQYFQGIAQRCPNIPLLYYHIPNFTGVTCKLFKLITTFDPDYCLST